MLINYCHNIVQSHFCISTCQFFNVDLDQVLLLKDEGQRVRLSKFLVLIVKLVNDSESFLVFIILLIDLHLGE